MKLNITANNNIVNSASVFLKFFIMAFNALKSIYKNGTMYNKNPKIPKLNINAGNSISHTSSLVLIKYPFPNSTNKGFF